MTDLDYEVNEYFEKYEKVYDKKLPDDQKDLLGNFAKLVAANYAKRKMDDSIHNVIKRMNDGETRKCVQQIIEENINDDGYIDTELVAGLVQDEILISLYREFDYPHLQQKDQFKHLRADIDEKYIL